MNAGWGILGEINIVIKNLNELTDNKELFEEIQNVNTHLYELEIFKLDKEHLELQIRENTEELKNLKGYDLERAGIDQREVRIDLRQNQKEIVMKEMEYSDAIGKLYETYRRSLSIMD